MRSLSASNGAPHVGVALIVLGAVFGSCDTPDLADRRVDCTRGCPDEPRGDHESVVKPVSDVPASD